MIWLRLLFFASGGAAFAFFARFSACSARERKPRAVEPALMSRRLKDMAVGLGANEAGVAALKPARRSPVARTLSLWGDDLFYGRKIRGSPPPRHPQK